MRRLASLTALSAFAVLTGLAPAARANTSAAIQDNVRHVTQVPGSTGGHSVVEGDRLYVGAYGLGLTVFDIKDPEAPVKIGEYKPALGQAGFAHSTSDPGARADTVPDAAVWNGRHIVSLGGASRAPSTTQTEFLDMTDPSAPVLLHRFKNNDDAESHNGDIVDSRRLWLPSGGGGGYKLRIYDMNPLLGATPAAPVRIASGNLDTMWLQSKYKKDLGKPSGPATGGIHDLEVYTDFDVLLLEDEWVDQNGDGTADPTWAKKDIAFYAATQGYPITVGAATVAPDSAVYIVDITDPRKPVVMNKIRGQVGQRYMHEVQLLDGDRHVMITADEDLHNGCNAGGVDSWRLSDDLTSVTYLDTWYIGTGTPAAVCSAHVFSSGGNFVFMGSYNAGLQVIDFTNPADLKRAGQYIAPGANSWGALYHKGYVYVGDFGPRGLDVFEFMGGDARLGTLPAWGFRNHTEQSGATETVAQCDQAHATNGADAFIVEIPQSMRDGTHRVRATADGTNGPYDLDLWFWNQDCELIDRVPHKIGRNPTGRIEKGDAYVSVTKYSGYATTAWVTFDVAP